MKRIFILEDNKDRIEAFEKMYEGHHLTVATTAQEAIALLEYGIDYDLISLDHDLGGEVFCSSELENSGYRVAKYLSDKDVSAEICIHSWNKPGAERMLELLPKAYYKPFGSI